MGLALLEISASTCTCTGHDMYIRGSPLTWFDIPLPSDFSLNLYLCTGKNWVKFWFGEELLVESSTEFRDLEFGTGLSFEGFGG